MHRLNLFVISLLCCIILLGCADDNSQKCDAILNLDGKNLYIEIADDDSTRELGLMFRKQLHQNSGMLFVFDREQILSFWMKNTRIPLSLAYIKKSGVISQIFDMKPYDERPHMSKEKVLYALEVNRGWFSKNNIRPGYKIEFPVSVIRR